MSWILPPVERGVAQLLAEPLQIPPHVPARGSMVGLDESLLDPHLHGASRDAKRGGGLSGRDVRHVGARWSTACAIFRVRARFSQMCVLRGGRARKPDRRVRRETAGRPA